MIYIVSGFMRSGTSMMMSCLEAGGMSVVKSERREEFGKVHSDDQYAVNANGLYEPDPAEFKESGWPRQHDGKAIKVVVPWLPHLAVHDYRVVFMRRDPEEIRQSYEAAFGMKLNADEIQQRCDLAVERLNNRRDVELIELQYAEVIAEPLSTFESLLYAGWPIGPVEAALAVDPSLYRFRLENLTVGI